jgi:hypothetical protein
MPIGGCSPRMTPLGLSSSKPHFNELDCVLCLVVAGPDDIPYLYCLFFITVAPLRWIYYRIKKWHYYLLVQQAWHLWPLHFHHSSSLTLLSKLMTDHW